MEAAERQLFASQAPIINTHYEEEKLMDEICKEQEESVVVRQASPSQSQPRNR